MIPLKSELAHKLVEANPARTSQELEEITQLSRKALSEVRSTVVNIQTPSLTHELDAAAKALTTAGIKATINAGDNPAPHIEVLFAWAVRETTTNVIRHSGAEHCIINTTPTSLTVLDDGCGIGESALGEGAAVSGAATCRGFRGLRKRAEEAGASLTTDSTDAGRTITITTNEP